MNSLSLRLLESSLGSYLHLGEDSRRRLTHFQKANHLPLGKKSLVPGPKERSLERKVVTCRLKDVNCKSQKLSLDQCLVSPSLKGFFWPCTGMVVPKGVSCGY